MNNVATTTRLLKGISQISFRTSSLRLLSSRWALHQQHPFQGTTTTRSTSYSSSWHQSSTTSKLPESVPPQDQSEQKIAYSPLTTIDFSQTSPPDYREWSVPQLYDELRLTAAKGLSAKVHALVRHLVRERQAPADFRIFRALILCNVNPEGSVAMVLEVLREIEEAGLQLDGPACHDVLRVLAVHPDYLLQAEVLAYMRDAWFELSLDGCHDVAAGLLRSLQFEMALERIDGMVEAGVKIRPWLLDMAIYILVEAEELDEVLRLLEMRAEMTDPIVTACMWNSVLDKAGAALHYDLITFVWNRRVKYGYLNPSTGICLAVLNAAARNGDAELATDVFRVLGERDTVFTNDHYEMLIEAYANAEDLRSAFAVLGVMRDVQVKPDANSVRPIVMYMQKGAERPRQGFEILKRTRDDDPGKPVPVAAMNACIEGALFHGDLELAIEFYKAMHVVWGGGSSSSNSNSNGGVDTSTFNVLIKGCAAAARKDLAMSLVDEMVARRVKPDQLTYDRLVLVCLGADDYEDAVRYYREMREQGFLPRNGTLVALVKTLAKAGDERTEALLEEIEKMGLSTRALRVWLKENCAVS